MKINFKKSMNIFIISMALCAIHSFASSAAAPDDLLDLCMSEDEQQQESLALKVMPELLPGSTDPLAKDINPYKIVAMQNKAVESSKKTLLGQNPKGIQFKAPAAARSALAATQSKSSKENLEGAKAVVAFAVPAPRKPRAVKNQLLQAAASAK
jgi:hypothetical protein